MFAPYSTDSKVGRRDTEMAGRHSEGMELFVYSMRSHANTVRSFRSINFEKG